MSTREYQIQQALERLQLLRELDAYEKQNKQLCQSIETKVLLIVKLKAMLRCFAIEWSTLKALDKPSHKADIREAFVDIAEIIADFKAFDEATRFSKDADNNATARRQLHE